MRNIGIYIANVVLAIALVIVAALYVSHQQTEAVQDGIQSFTGQTEALEQVASRYLVAEQEHCDSWANTINGTNMTMDEAIAFLRIAALNDKASAHIVYTDTLQGQSTTAKNTDAANFAVDYTNYNLFSNMSLSASDESTALNVTRSFTSPTSGEASIAFCDRVWLTDNGEQREAILMHVMPLSYFKEQWVFPTSGEYEQAEIALVSSTGEYVIKSESMKNNNLIEFLKSYNSYTTAELESIEAEIAGPSGYIEVKDSRGNDCVLTHAPLATNSATGNSWVLVGFVPKSALQATGADFTFAGLLAFGLILMLAINLIYFTQVNRRLNAARAEAEAANHAKSDFLSSMSHDIRTPMNAIIGLTSIASHNIDDPEAVKESLDKISHAGDHLLTLINDVLDISKVESGNISLNPIAFSITELAENLISIVESSAQEKQLDFSFNVHDIDREYLFADQLRVNQVFINILSNAIKYTNPGGSVRVDLSEAPIVDNPNLVRVTYRVADTGIGMSEDFQKTMYDTFSRATDSRVNKVLGTGLGLAICKQMVDLMGGTIACESAEGQGTTFTVTLDLLTTDKQAYIATEATDDDSSDSNLSGTSILVAEDNDLNWEIISELLDEHNIKTTRRENGKLCVEELETCREGAYDLVFMDIQMPVMNGYEAARAIRASQRDYARTIPIFAMTADAFSEDITRCLEAGMNGHIAKPVDMHQVFKAIHTAKGGSK